MTEEGRAQAAARKVNRKPAPLDTSEPVQRAIWRAACQAGARGQIIPRERTMGLTDYQRSAEGIDKHAAKIAVLMESSK